MPHQTESNMVPLTDVLGQLGAELRLMADVLGIVEEAVARIIAMVGERGNAIAGDLQNIDIIDQSLHALSAFIRELASDVPPDWSVDAGLAAKSLTLATLAGRLRFANSPAEAGHAAASDFEMFD